MNVKWKAFLKLVISGRLWHIFKRKSGKNAEIFTKWDLISFQCRRLSPEYLHLQQCRLLNVSFSCFLSSKSLDTCIVWIMKNLEIADEILLNINFAQQMKMQMVIELLWEQMKKWNRCLKKLVEQLYILRYLIVLPTLVISIRTVLWQDNCLSCSYLSLRVK